MKKSITYLGIALAVFTNIQAATFKSETRSVAQNAAIENEQGDSVETGTKKLFAPVEDATVLNPETILPVENPKSMDDVIAENNKITENIIENERTLLFIEKSPEEIIADDNKIIDAGNVTQIRPLYLERTIEDEIRENNAIIEDQVSTEAQPLDFENINRNQTIVKQTNIKLMVGMN